MAQDKELRTIQLATDVFSGLGTEDSSSATLLRLISRYHELRANACRLDVEKDKLTELDTQFGLTQEEAIRELPIHGLHSGEAPERLEQLFSQIRVHSEQLIMLAGQKPKDTDTEVSAYMQDLTSENIRMIVVMFPSCLTETLGADGNPKAAIDFDLLRQALCDEMVEGRAERYELNWPGKRQALLNGTHPIAKTLRPVREESVDFDNTQNLFIEGDNLDALEVIEGRSR
jgi:hypothetical protein